MNSQSINPASGHSKLAAASIAGADVLEGVDGAKAGHLPEQALPAAAARTPSAKRTSVLARLGLQAFVLDNPVPILLGAFTLGVVSGRRLFHR
jgi:hypothetical protein